MKRITLLLLLVCCIGLQGYATKIKVACVGNSITAGAAASDRATKGYVGVLTQMMGEEYDVRNFGVSGATCCRNTHKPYDQLDAFTKAKEFEPDIVTIALGTNDSQPKVWNTGEFARNFEADLNYLCDEFANLSSKPQIYLCLPIPIFPSERWKHQPEVLANEIIPIIKKVAKERGYPIIDLYSALSDKGEECYPANDKLHPNDLGHKMIAETIYPVVTAKKTK